MHQSHKHHVLFMFHDKTKSDRFFAAFSQMEVKATKDRSDQSSRTYVLIR